jgi:3-isopropylmalate/(R)-2-methylmalate dehydratase large subunit
MSAGTCTAQILRRAQVADGPEQSAYFWAEPDLLLGHEATVALLLDRIELAEKQGFPAIKYPQRCLFAADHFVPPATAERASILHRYIDFLTRRGLDLRYLFAGISHQLMLEDERVRPGMFIAGADSHTILAGALGCAATGFGSTDMLAAYVLGRVAVRICDVVRIDVRGAPDSCVGTRDAALALMRQFGEGGLAYRSLEVFDGSARGMDMATRASLANQAVEAGAKFCIVVPDEVTADFLTARDGREPDRDAWVLPSHDAQYTDVFTLDLNRLEPLVARPPSPADVVPVREMQGEKINQAFVGSCAGGRYEDLVEAAEVLSRHKVAAGVRMVVTPASRAVYLNALRAGVIEKLVEAGALVTDSSCGACGGIDKGLLAAEEVCVSTSNRNYRGRMGHKDARIFLASAKTAAASAITGRLTDPREIKG